MTSSPDRQKHIAFTADEIGRLLRKHTLSVVDVIKATSQRINEDNQDGLKLAAIGTENDGSILQPSSPQALYTLKPTRGLIDSSGAFRMSRSLDTPGAMA